MSELLSIKCDTMVLQIKYFLDKFTGNPVELGVAGLRLAVQSSAFRLLFREGTCAPPREADKSAFQTIAARLHEPRNYGD